MNQWSLSQEEISHYQEHGYLVLRGILDEEALSALLAECMEPWSQEKDAFDPQATWLKNALLPNIHHQSELVRDYYFEGPLVDVAEQLIGPNIKGATSQLTFKMRGNDKPFGWHQDNGYGHLKPANSLTTLTALDDTDEENGCLWILPGSHKRGQIDVSRIMTREAKAASKTRDRRILFLRYADADATEVYNGNLPRLGPLLRGTSKFPDVIVFEQELRSS